LKIRARAFRVLHSREHGATGSAGGTSVVARVANAYAERRPEVNRELPITRIQAPPAPLAHARAMRRGPQCAAGNRGWRQQRTLDEPIEGL
jgi:hypothetical protein